MKPMIEAGIPTLSLWNDFFQTDPAYTKDFSRAGGFKGTAITPMLAAFRLTKTFGPMGKGWGLECQDVRIHTASGGDTLVYILVALWYVDPDDPTKRCYAGPQWGGDKIEATTKSGLRSDDEAFKKAMTDGFIKCASYLGIGADIHSGMFDDVKYFNSLEEKFSEAKKPKVGKTTTGDPVTEKWNELYTEASASGINPDTLRAEARKKLQEWVGHLPADDPSKPAIILKKLDEWIEEIKNVE